MLYYWYWKYGKKAHKNSAVFKKYKHMSFDITTPGILLFLMDGVLFLPYFPCLHDLCGELIDRIRAQPYTVKG